MAVEVNDEAPMVASYYLTKRENGERSEYVSCGLASWSRLALALSSWCSTWARGVALEERKLRLRSARAKVRSSRGR